MAKKYQPFEKAGTKLSLFEIISSNFIGGIAWALGATIGLALIFTILGLIAKNINLVPIVGTFASQVIDFILATNPRVGR
jgi:hypothetical protein